MNVEVAISHHSLLDSNVNTKKEDHHSKCFHELFNYHNMEMLAKGLPRFVCLFISAKQKLSNVDQRTGLNGVSFCI